MTGIFGFLTQAVDQLMNVMTHGSGWLLMMAALLIFVVSIILRRIPVVIGAVLIAACMWYSGNVLGIDSGEQTAIARVAANNAKIKAEQEAKILDMAEELDAIAEELTNTSEALEKVQADNKKTITELVATKIQQSKERADAKEIVDERDACLSRYVPDDIVQSLREADLRRFSGPAISTDKKQGKSQ